MNTLTWRNADTEILSQQTTNFFCWYLIYGEIKRKCPFDYGAIIRWWVKHKKIY